MPNPCHKTTAGGPSQQKFIQNKLVIIYFSVNINFNIVVVVKTIFRGNYMNKAQLIDKLANVTNSTKADCQVWLDCFIDIVTKEMRNDEVRLAGFGTLTHGKRAPRNGVNPQTGQKMHIPGCRVPKFRPATELRNYINK